MGLKQITYSNTEHKDFYKVLRKRVNAYFKDNNKTRYADTNMVLKTIFMLSLYLVPFILMLTIVTNTWLVMLMWVLMGFGTAGVGLSIMHDANHQAYSKNKWVNKIIGKLTNAVGGSDANWRIQHNVLHHTFTNIKGQDEDIDAGRIIRFSKHSKWFNIHKFQKYYSFFLYGLLTINWAITTDFKQMNNYLKRKLSYGKFPNPATEWTKLIISKIVYYAIWIVLPLLVLDLAWWKIFIGFFIMLIL